MCGIVYAESFDGSPVNNLVFDQYAKQRNRGTQGFGIFDGQELNMVHEANEEKIVKWLSKYDSNLLLMHHRFPTSTINVKRAAHPFSTKDYFGDTQYILVHNGGIRNAFELYEEHEKLGIEYYSVLQDYTFNDSEALLWDFALTIEGKQEKLKSKGGIAFICLKLVKGKLERMYFGRNYNPLNMLRTKQGISLASEGEGTPIEPHTLYNWNYKAKRLTKREFSIDKWESTYTYNPTGQPLKNWQNDWDDGYDVHCPECVKKTYACVRHDNWTVDTSNVLKKQFGKKFGVPELETHQTKILLPAVVSREESEASYIARTDPIDEEEVVAEYMAYLAHARGVFETAYWVMEADYDYMLELGNKPHEIRQRVLLERVMEKIQNDPEYVDEKSISNVWETLWHAQT
jgi:predicted glutamine amidotransferase